MIDLLIQDLILMPRRETAKIGLLPLILDLNTSTR